ncbi:osteocalcin [Python bivittatus]|uniref:Osteocalcin n=1 Tax=Python bivittatus TaxID=176946 RepID=A0A9F5IYJ2_PYTBI|nr:osteocalcin [Python bivittatus]
MAPNGPRDYFLPSREGAEVKAKPIEDSAHSKSANESPSSEAFVSRRVGAEIVKRQKRNYNRYRAAPNVAVDPLEAHREVCELSPACDELADHIGFQEAYRRFYGPI